jgi:tetratricopeptide (TPR) repeat protein
MVKVGAHYWLKLLFPMNLSAHYDQNDFPVPGSLFEPTLLLAAVTHLAILGSIILAYRTRHRTAAFAIAWVPITLLPYSHIVRFEWLMAERFLYIPSVGFVIALTLLGGGLLSFVTAPGRSRRAAGALALLLLLGGYGARCVVRNRDWKDNVTFFGVIARDKPWVAGARYAHGNALLEERRYQEAIGEYEAALRLWPELDAARQQLDSARRLKQARDAER